MSKRRINEGGFRKDDYKDNGYFHDDSAKKHLTKICDYIYKIESRLGDTHTPYYECVGKIMDILSEYGINPSWTVNESITRHNNKQLHNIIKESVKNILKERTKNEMGLSDDEVSRNRTTRFANIVDPEYCDSIYDDEQENYMNRMNARRKQHHLATQKHKSNMENSYDW